MSARSSTSLPLRVARSRGWALSMSQVWAFAAVAAPIVAVLALRLESVDLAYHIRAGETILSTGHLPRVDAYTFTANGLPWFDQQWGAQALFAGVHRLGGWPGLVALRATLVGSIFLFVFLVCRANGASSRAASVLALGSFLGTLPGLHLRPQLLGLALFALTLWLLSGRAEHPARPAAVPVVTAAWVNLHGSFFLAPLLLGLAWFQDRHDRRPGHRQLAWLAAASAFATLVNPFGWRVWGYVVELTTDPVVRGIITEWSPPNVGDVAGAAFFASAAAVAGFLAMHPRRLGGASLLTLGLFFALGLTAFRSILWWGLIAPTVVATALAPAPRTREGEDPPTPLGAAVVATVLAAGAAFLPWWRGADPSELVGRAPVALTGELERQLRPGDRIFTPQWYGSWLELSLPDRPVFVDSRIEVFPRLIWSDYEAVVLGKQGWQRILDRWEVDAVVATSEWSEGLLARIANDPGWRLVHHDAEGYVFVRA